MSIRKMIYVGVVILPLMLMSLSCAGKVPGNDGGVQGELHVAAASDLRFAFEEMGAIFEEEEGIAVVFQFGSSGNLAQQIAGGAPIDLYASANKYFVEELIDSGDILADTTALYAIGRIVLAVNREAQVNVTSLEDLLSDQVDVIALANPDHAPYGMAAKQALETSGLWQRLEDKLVYGENVSQALQFVQTGNAPVGLIALSIANVEGIDYTLIDDSLHQPLEQMLGVVSHSEQKEAALAFARFVNSPVGREIMEKYGFILP